MIIKYFTNNLDCLCWIEQINNKYYYVDNTKGYYYEIKEQDINNYLTK